MSPRTKIPISAGRRSWRHEKSLPCFHGRPITLDGHRLPRLHRALILYLSSSSWNKYPGEREGFGPSHGASRHHAEDKATRQVRECASPESVFPAGSEVTGLIRSPASRSTVWRSTTQKCESPPRWRALHPAKPGKLSVWTTPRFPEFSPSVKRKPCFR